MYITRVRLHPEFSNRTGLLRTKQMTPGMIDMCIRKGSADGWDCLGPGTTPAIFFKENLILLTSKKGIIIFGTEPTAHRGFVYLDLINNATKNSKSYIRLQSDDLITT